MRECNIKISQCNHEHSHFAKDYEKTTPDVVAVCEDCGGKQIGLEWQGVCKGCGKIVDELYALFVPHLCRECYVSARNEEIRLGHICRGCRQPFIDCCC